MRDISAVERMGLFLIFAALVSLQGVAQASAGSTASAKLAPESTPVSGTVAALPANPEFDVAAIHLNNYDRTNHSHINSDAKEGHFRCTNVSALQIIQWGYELPEFRVLNVPEWARSTRYDIEAKSDPEIGNQLHSLPYDAARTELEKMVEAMLAERFHLVAHMETRKLPIYDLVVAKGGAKFSAVENGPKQVNVSGRGNSVSIKITSSSHATNDLAETLYRYTGRVVVDKTGLAGNYSLELHFAPDDYRTAVPSSADAAAAPDSGPSVFTALKEQLGLELKSGKGAIEVLVVDRIDPPSEN